jgi:hypothetical protein
MKNPPIILQETYACSERESRKGKLNKKGIEVTPFLSLEFEILR